LVPAVIGASLGLAVTFVLFLNDAPNDKPGYAAAVRQAGPSVVNIYSSKVLEPAVCQQPWFREWCERFADVDPEQMQTSLGSGVIAQPGGYILTNYHVIAGADEIFVMFADGVSTIARLIGADPETDLAVIQVATQGLTPIEIPSSDQVEVGDLVLAIGNPFGIGQTVSAGIVSAKGRAGISESLYDDFIQTDAAINPGNSGGALIDTEGRLVGINTLIFSPSGGSQGIGFALPARLVVAILDEIIATGKVTRGWLGVTLNQPLGGSAGLLVTQVAAASPAGQAGVLPGDLIVSVNGIAASNLIQVSGQIAETDPGGNILMSLERNGRLIEVVATAAERPPDL
jgi:serine protease DegS